MNDRQKVLYGKIMLAAAPMFERLEDNEQIELIQIIGNKLMMRAQGKSMCAADAHITDIDNPNPFHPYDTHRPSTPPPWPGPAPVDTGDDDE
jgi:hypothetical protein